MNPETENFEELRRLLALKRYEQPPPGYFTNFSAKVIARIEAQQQAAALPWWKRLLPGLDPKPALIFACSLGFGGLLIAGLMIGAPDSDVSTASLPTQNQLVLISHPVVTAANIPAAAPNEPVMSIQPIAVQDQQPSAMDGVLNPDSAPAGMFSPNGSAAYLKAGAVNSTPPPPVRVSLQLNGQ